MTEATHPAGRKRPVGRRAGDSGTRNAILDAARDLFAERGYEGASMRAIASRAGVDTGLIRHFFKDKETLFANTMADRTVIPERLAATFAGPPETLGVRLTDVYLRLWEEPDTRPILLGLLRSAMTSDHGAELLIEVIGGRIRGEDAPPISDDPKVRGLALAASQLFGVAIARNVLRVPVLSELTHDELVATIGSVVQDYLTRT
jgi:AcrR family transcriptional regulator